MGLLATSCHDLTRAAERILYDAPQFRGIVTADNAAPGQEGLETPYFDVFWSFHKNMLKTSPAVSMMDRQMFACFHDMVFWGAGKRVEEGFQKQIHICI